MRTIPYFILLIITFLPKNWGMRRPFQEDKKNIRA